MKRFLPLLPAAAFAIASCNRAKSPAEAGGPQGPMPVLTQTPVSQKISDWDEFTARIEAVDSVEIRPRITGYIDKVVFHAGQMVKAGDLLFEIDPRFEEAALATADAALATAEARLKSAQSEADRVETLIKSHAISNEEADTRRNALAVAKAAVRSGQAGRDGALLNLDFTKVRAPVDGRVGIALQTKGNYVSGVAGFTTLLTSVVSVDPVYVYASVDDASFLRYSRLIREKKLPDPKVEKVAVELKIEGGSEWTHKGWIETFDNRIDPTTGSIAVRCVFPNPDGSLVPGSFSRLRIPGSAEYDAMLIDEKYVQTNQDVKYLMVVSQDSKAEVRPVTLGRSYKGQRIILSGLNPSDKVITSGLQILAPGAQVQPIAPQPAATAEATQAPKQSAPTTASR
ncbi:MAG: efflux RND transporter periplasmic adaptor subunit [Verrucomicrobiaceae bacterium]|nr:MAG: efflux RND transporter periplasmic adaptor subunit [Verrucomicrobiaceae bacterium]